jgi:hypothetical protein
VSGMLPVQSVRDDPGRSQLALRHEPSEMVRHELSFQEQSAPRSADVVIRAPISLGRHPAHALARDVSGSSKILQIFGLQLAQWGVAPRLSAAQAPQPFVGGAKNSTP